MAMSGAWIHNAHHRARPPQSSTVKSAESLLKELDDDGSDADDAGDGADQDGRTRSRGRFDELPVALSEWVPTGSLAYEEEMQLEAELEAKAAQSATQWGTSGGRPGQTALTAAPEAVVFARGGDVPFGERGGSAGGVHVHSAGRSRDSDRPTGSRARRRPPINHTTADAQLRTHSAGSMSTIYGSRPVSGLSSSSRPQSGIPSRPMSGVSRPQSGISSRPMSGISRPQSGMSSRPSSSGTQFTKDGGGGGRDGVFGWSRPSSAATLSSSAALAPSRPLTASSSYGVPAAGKSTDIANNLRNRSFEEHLRQIYNDGEQRLRKVADLGHKDKKHLPRLVSMLGGDPMRLLGDDADVEALDEALLEEERAAALVPSLPLNKSAVGVIDREYSLADKKKHDFNGKQGGAPVVVPTRGEAEGLRKAYDALNAKLRAGLGNKDPARKARKAISRGNFSGLTQIVDAQQVVLDIVTTELVRQESLLCSDRGKVMDMVRDQWVGLTELLMKALYDWHQERLHAQDVADELVQKVEPVRADNKALHSQIKKLEDRNAYVELELRKAKLEISVQASIIAGNHGREDALTQDLLDSRVKDKDLSVEMAAMVDMKMQAMDDQLDHGKRIQGNLNEQLVLREETIRSLNQQLTVRKEEIARKHILLMWYRAIYLATRRQVRSRVDASVQATSGPVEERGGGSPMKRSKSPGKGKDKSPQKLAAAERQRKKELEEAERKLGFTEFWKEMVERSSAIDIRFRPGTVMQRGDILAFVGSVLHHKMIGDLMDNFAMLERKSMASYVHMSLVLEGRDSAEVQEVSSVMVCNVLYFESTCRRVSMFRRMLGIGSDQMDAQMVDWYLWALKWIRHDSWLPLPAQDNIKVPLALCNRVLEKAFGAKKDPAWKMFWAGFERAFPGMKQLDADAFLFWFVAEMEAQTAKNREVMASVYAEYDEDGDGNLDVDEFHAMVGALNLESPIDYRKALRMYSEMALRGQVDRATFTVLADRHNFSVGQEGVRDAQQQLEEGIILDWDHMSNQLRSTAKAIDYTLASDPSAWSSLAARHLLRHKYTLAKRFLADKRDVMSTKYLLRSVMVDCENWRTHAELPPDQELQDVLHPVARGVRRGGVMSKT